MFPSNYLFTMSALPLLASSKDEENDNISHNSISDFTGSNPSFLRSLKFLHPKVNTLLQGMGIVWFDDSDSFVWKLFVSFWYVSARVSMVIIIIMLVVAITVYLPYNKRTGEATVMIWGAGFVQLISLLPALRNIFERLASKTDESELKVISSSTDISVTYLSINFMSIIAYDITTQLFLFDVGEGIPHYYETLWVTMVVGNIVLVVFNSFFTVILLFAIMDCRVIFTQIESMIETHHTLTVKHFNHIRTQIQSRVDKTALTNSIVVFWVLVNICLCVGIYFIQGLYTLPSIPAYLIREILFAVLLFYEVVRVNESANRLTRNMATSNTYNVIENGDHMQCNMERIVICNELTVSPIAYTILNRRVTRMDLFLQLFAFITAMIIATVKAFLFRF